MATLKYWLWLSTRRGLRPGGIPELLERFGTPEAVYFAPPAEYRLAGLSASCLDSLQEKSLDGAERILADCDRIGARILTIQDAEYPERLRQIFDPPAVLYLKGKTLAFDEAVAIGVVGARHPSEYGKRMAERLGQELARAGAVVVSGIAQGLDCEALRGALSAGGVVASVLGAGVDVFYPPQNRWLYEDVAARGVLISEYPPGTPVESWHFPVRNRIISGLSVGVAAVEAGGTRSGTLVTMRLALEQDRDTYAFPGPADAAMSEGTNRLIQRGEAKLVLSAWDILNEYETRFPGKLKRTGPLPARTPATSPRKTGGVPETGKTVDNKEERAYITLKEAAERFTDDERDILLALQERPLVADELSELTQIPVRRVSTALTMLQIQGCVEERPGRRFVSAVRFKTE